MARIVTEYGKGREFTLCSRNRTVLFVLGRIWSGDKNTIRFYKDKIEICKHSQLRNKFTLYDREDFVDAKKGITVYIVPFIFALLLLVCSILLKEGLLTVPVWFILPFSFGRCIVLKRRKGLPVRLPYGAMDYSEMAEKIIGEFK